MSAPTANERRRGWFRKIRSRRIAPKPLSPLRVGLTTYEEGRNLAAGATRDWRLGVYHSLLAQGDLDVSTDTLVAGVRSEEDDPELWLRGKGEGYPGGNDE